MSGVGRWTRLLRWFGYWGRGRAITIKSPLNPAEVQQRLATITSYPSAGLFETYLQDPTDLHPLRGVLVPPTFRVHVPLKLWRNSSLQFAGSVEPNPDGSTSLIGRMRYPIVWRASYPIVLVLCTLWFWIGLGAPWMLLLAFAAHALYVRWALADDQQILTTLAGAVEGQVAGDSAGG